MSNVKVFVLSHDEKSLDIALNNINEQTKYKNIFIPVLCGEKDKEFFTPEKYPNVLRDSTNNRFAAYNKYFNEITAMYWLAKNYDLPDYVGISHYRRILPLNDEIMSWLENPRQIVVFDGFSDRECDYMYNSWQNQVEAHDKKIHFIENLKIYKYRNEDLYPKNIFDLIFPYVLNASIGVQYRYLSIMPKKMFKDMMDFYENILDHHVKAIDSNKYPNVNREFGFVLEYLYSHFVNIYSKMYFHDVHCLGKNQLWTSTAADKQK